MNKNILYYGSKDDLPISHHLKAGPLHLLYERGLIRQIKVGSIEVIRMIYFAVRDHNWQTIDGEIQNENLEINPNSFTITFTSLHKNHNIEFLFDCRIKGSQDGNIDFKFSGQAKSSFKRNRIGFCVLHPVKECAGKEIIITEPDGKKNTGIFPVKISPHQPFINIQKMQWSPGKNISAALSFEGDIFEMEDQRNWSDASYKTYCTPLNLPFPVEINEGTSIEQKVSLSISGDRTVIVKDIPEDVLKIHSNRKGLKLPEIGIGPGSVNREFSDPECHLLDYLNFDFIRVDVELDKRGEDPRQRQMLKNAMKLGLPIHLGIHFYKDIEKELEYFDSIFHHYPIKKCLLFSKTKICSPDDLINRVVPVLRKKYPSLCIGSGSKAYFTEFNRSRPDLNQVDFAFYSINPQVHAYDNLSLVENLQALPDTVSSCRAISQHLPIYISPITFRPRFNPDATRPESKITSGHLPPQVDPRQMSLFGAGWTLGSIRNFTFSEVASVDYFEPVGWRGIIQGDFPSSIQEKFMADSGDVFPMYFVFYWLFRLKNSAMVITESSDPLKFSALGFDTGEGIKIMICNHTSDLLHITIDSDQSFQYVNYLDERNVLDFKKDPCRILKKSPEKLLHSNSISMLPFGLAVLQ